MSFVWNTSQLRKERSTHVSCVVCCCAIIILLCCVMFVVLQENVDQMPTGLMLIGNKHDLDEMNEREVSTETGETFAKVSSLSPPPPVPLSLPPSLSPSLSLALFFPHMLTIYNCVSVSQIYNAHFMETSAKTGFNVGNCLMNLVRYATHTHTHTH